MYLLFRYFTNEYQFLDKLRNYYGYDYDASNNKKYIVQLYYATIQLKTAGVKNRIK